MILWRSSSPKSSLTRSSARNLKNIHHKSWNASSRNIAELSPQALGSFFKGFFQMHKKALSENFLKNPWEAHSSSREIPSPGIRRSAPVTRYPSSGTFVPFSGSVEKHAAEATKIFQQKPWKASNRTLGKLPASGRSGKLLYNSGKAWDLGMDRDLGEHSA